MEQFSEQVKRVERIPEYVSNAFRAATSGIPGPAYLEIPIDIVNGVTEEENVKYPDRYRTESRAFGDPEYIQKVTDILKDAERPMVLAGSDIWWCDASAQLREFVEKIDMNKGAHRTIVDAHIDVMWVALNENVHDEGDERAQKLKSLVQEAINKYS